MFRVLDRDGDGRVRAGQLRIALEGFGLKLSREEAQAMLDVVKELGAEDFVLDDFVNLVRRVDIFNEDRRISCDSDSSCSESQDKGTDE